MRKLSNQPTLFPIPVKMRKEGVNFFMDFFSSLLILDTALMGSVTKFQCLFPIHTNTITILSLILPLTPMGERKIFIAAFCHGYFLISL